MNAIHCPRCTEVMPFIPDLAGKTVRCPNCNARITMAHPLAASSVPLPPAVPAMPAMERESTSDRSTGQRASSRSRPSSRRRSPRLSTPSTSLLDLFDFKFEKYLTPWIIRITWGLVLGCAAMWIMAIGLGIVATWMPESTQARERPEARERPNATRLEFIAPNAEAPIWLRKRLITTVAGITGCIAVIIAVLWIRVSLETVIVVFNMAKSLASIDETLGDSQQ